MQPLGIIIKVLSIYWYRGILTAYFKGENENSSGYNVLPIVLKNIFKYVCRYRYICNNTENPDKYNCVLIRELEVLGQKI